MTFFSRELITMPNKLKAGVISLAIITLLTIIKFFAYWLSGSLAVFSEAWHSFSDITTTALVVVTLWLSCKREATSTSIQPTDAQPDTATSETSWKDPELLIALFISIWLFIIALSIFLRIISSEPVLVTNPLITGVVFILLSFGSFFIYRFEAMTADIENSAALKADSQHNRTDMVISLLTGFSLIIYHFGVNLDKYISGVIALMIFLFAIETGINTLLAMTKHKHGYLTEYRITTMIFSLFDRHIGNKIVGWFCDSVDLNQNNRDSLASMVGVSQKLFRYTLIIAALVTTMVWISTSLVQVEINQQAVITRFGQITNPGKPIEPGLHFKLPWPIEKANKIDTTKAITIEVGNVSDKNSALIWGKSHGDNLEFMSADNNFFQPYISLHFRISDAEQYYLNTTDAKQLASQICMQELIFAFSRYKFYELALYQREKWVSEAITKIQNRLDQLQSGIEIVRLDLKDFHPPINVSNSFEQLVAATQTRETMINQAKTKHNVMIPDARLKSLELVSEAQSDSNNKLQLALGESKKYLLQLDSYQQYPDIITKHLQLSSMLNSFKGSEKIVYEPQSGISTDLLYKERFLFKRQGDQEQEESREKRFQPPQKTKEVIRRAPIRD
ncbi:MAG: hypothetical protein D6B28_09520 [Gammaproteobacteria bacterium]|nr:MAG: hypothetical protein D6B28_09520 [Gammaproteobacteria bacterium]